MAQCDKYSNGNRLGAAVTAGQEVGGFLGVSSWGRVSCGWWGLWEGSGQ